MNKGTRWLVGLVALLVVANIVMAASIWLKKDKTVEPQIQGGDAREYLIKSLSLNAAQVKAFDSLRQGHFSRMKAYKEKMRELKDGLFAQLTWPRNAQADTLAKRIGELQARIDLETFEHFSQLRDLLSHQQAQKFDSTIQQVLRTMGPRDGRPDGPPPPGGRDGQMGPPPGEGPDAPPPPDRSPQ